MLERLFPSEHHDTIFDVDYKKLAKDGYKGIIFDIDNTLVPYNVIYPDDKIIALFEELKVLGFRTCLASNNNSKRVTTFNERLNVVAIPSALKPMTRNLKRAMTLLKTKRKNTVIIGDQLFTDVLAGNRLGIKTILVMPIEEKEQFITKIKRRTEKKIFNKYLKMRKKDV
jgi:HAD superfamily phosphatase (TIGR01668 family)